MAPEHRSQPTPSARFAANARTAHGAFGALLASRLLGCDVASGTLLLRGACAHPVDPKIRHEASCAVHGADGIWLVSGRVDTESALPSGRSGGVSRSHRPAILSPEPVARGDDLAARLRRHSDGHAPLTARTVGHRAAELGLSSTRTCPAEHARAQIGAGSGRSPARYARPALRRASRSTEVGSEDVVPPRLARISTSPPVRSGAWPVVSLTT